MRALALSVLVALAGGCELTEPPGAIGCEPYIHTLEARFAPTTGASGKRTFHSELALPSEHELLRSLRDSLRELRRARVRRVNILALSGGGQWGAFGAGFLNGWSEADRHNGSVVKRQDIHIVTGISTGALQSTYALLGPAWDERLTETYLGTGPEQPDGLRENPITDDRLFRMQGLLEIMFSNAVADPRGRLDSLVENAVSEMIGKVAETGPDRRLYIGAVKLEDGGFRIFDLKALAEAAAEAQSGNRPTESQALEKCYAEMLLAAAAIPAMFPPRYIESSAYVDGGARYGAFIRAVDLAASADRGPAFDEKNIFVIMNGDLQVEPRDTVKNRVVNLAQRSLAAVIDQIYKDSVFRIEMEARQGGPEPWTTRYVFVDDTTCREDFLSGVQDEEHQFDPYFMKCLYDLGLERGREQRWLTFDAVPRAIR